MWDLQTPAVKQNPPSLSQWLYHAIQAPDFRLRIRLRGNNLHVLLEGNTAPSLDAVLPPLVQALETETESFYHFFRNTEDPLYKLILYGRKMGQDRPAWIESIILADLQSSLPSTAGGATAPGVALVSNESLARSGAPDAIARYLSESLSHLGVSVKVLVQKLPQLEEEAEEESPQRRLWVICSCDYSPDASLIAEPIAQQLRELELEGFREAVIRSQVSGEAAPDWVLQVDLTHPKELLDQWSKWGDELAINRLLNQAVARDGLQVRAIVQETTLHIFCILHPSDHLATDAPPANIAIKGISQCLSTMRPQGLKAAAIYGIQQHKLTLLTTDPTPDLTDLQADPAWVNWLPLPASHQPDLALSPHTLAQQKHPTALTFLLQRLLNPDIDGFLATGGIRVKLCFRNHVLHVMTEALVCPRQTLVVGKVEPFLAALQIQDVTSVRIYGRRAGQSSPLWTVAVNFEPPLLGESALEPVVTVLTALEPLPTAPLAVCSPRWDLWRWARCSESRLQQAFCQTGIFGTRPDAAWQPTTPSRWQGQQGWRGAIAWSLVGFVLMMQIDAWLGRQLQTWQVLDEEEAEVSLSLETDLTRGTGKSAVSAAILAAARAKNPDFNNRLLNEKLALYQERVKRSGPPDILIVGSSRAMRGIDPSVLSELLGSRYGAERSPDIFNFGINGATVQVVDVLLRQILTPEQLPKIILWADGARAFNSGRPDSTFEAIASSEGYQQIEQGQFPPQAQQSSSEPAEIRPNLSWANLQKSLGAGYQGLNQDLQDLVGSRLLLHGERDRLQAWLRAQFTEPVSLMEGINPDDPDSILINSQEPIDADGFLALDLRFDPDTYYRRHPRVSGAYDNDYFNFDLTGQQDEALQQLLRYLNRQRVDLVFINLPLTQDYLDPIRGEHEQEFVSYMRDMARRSRFTFRNLSQRWETEYEFFSDPSHLNRYGAQQVSVHLAEKAQIRWDLKLE